MFVSEDQIAAQMRAWPGLGRLQAINRIKQGRYYASRQSRRFVSTNWVKYDD